MFKLLESKKVEKLDVEIFEYEHEVTKTKHIHIKADDKNNGFCCALKTLPYSDNGIMHILEHCVLQGSEDFPLKDVFTSLHKNSLNTFMNAMTGPSYTMYPFTSQTEKDFFNLMHVYTNTVFFPLLKKETFLQEGWRFEFEEAHNKESDIKVNGVVYNEMIGALSSPYRHVLATVAEKLYPDTIYAHESGGIPKTIPSLTYEEFVDYHKNYYHPSNAVFITYGDIEAKTHQDKLQDLVLKHFDYHEVKLENTIQTPFDTPRSFELDYPYKGEDFEDKNFFVKAYSVAEFKDLQEIFTIDFLNSLMAGDSSSILTKNLEKSKLAASNFSTTYDFNSKYDVVIGVEGVKLENVSKVDEIIKDTLQYIAENGFDQETIEKELHQFELNQRTKYHNINNLAYEMIDKASDAALNKLDTAILLDPTELLENLKQDIKNPEFIKNFVKEKFLDNNHQVSITLVASNEKAKTEAEELEAVAKDKQKTLTADDRQAILDDFIALEAYQAEEDEEGILPELHVSDISLDFDLQNLETVEKNGKTIYAFSTPTSGVTLYNRSTFIKGLNASQAPYINIYTNLFDKLGFADMSYDEAASFESTICDGLTLSIALTEDRNDPNKIYARAAMATKMLRENISVVKENMSKKLATLRFDEKDKIIHELKRSNSYHQNTYFNAGHQVAIEMAKANISKIDNLAIRYNGIEYLAFLKDLVDNIDNDKVYDNLISELKKVHKAVLASFDEYILATLDSKEDIDDTIEKLYEDNIIENIIKHPISYDLTDYDKNITLSKATSANYCVMMIPAPYIDHELSGALMVLAKIIDGDYAHVEIREKAGAYGGYASYNPHSEIFALLSYRDPNISKTFEVYKNFKNWLEKLEVSDKQIEEGILQSIAGIDSPQSKVSQCSKALTRFFDDVTNDDITGFREKVLKADKATIQKAIDEIIMPKLDDAIFTALVNKDQYEKEALSFKTLEI